MQTNSTAANDNSKMPKVSVCVVTYNQEKYIRQCLQSIVDQETDFDFEVVVADDCSTDGTREIIMEFAQRYPTLIRPFFHKNNIGPYKNFIFVHQQAKGEYIAHVDGDDYCLPGKLKAQAAILDEHPNCNLVWHRMLIETASGVIKEGPFKNLESIGDIEFNRADIIQYMSIGLNSSKMYRKSVRDFDEPNFEIVDYFANVEQIGNGVARFTGYQPYGVYRVGIGIASSGVKTRQILANSFIYFNKKYPQYRLQVNTAALLYFLADLKNLRKTWIMFFGVWIKTFHLGSPLRLMKSWHIRKHLKITR